MTVVSNFKLRKMLVDDLKLIFEWRNHPDIRSCMFDTKEISWESHSAWFKSANENNEVHLFVLRQVEQPIGFMSFVPTKFKGVYDWGFYMAPHLEPGYGAILGKLALEKAFEDLSFRKICGSVLSKNIRSINFHKKMGFKQEGCLFEHHECDNEPAHDVFLFGLTKQQYTLLKGDEK